MLIHLESGACDSGISEEDVDDLALECFQSRKYMQQVEDGDGEWIYKCSNCETQFLRLSGLYQHTENVSACSFLLKGAGCLARLRYFISNRL